MLLLELTDREFKISLINRTKCLVEKIANTHWPDKEFHQKNKNCKFLFPFSSGNARNKKNAGIKNL